MSKTKIVIILAAIAAGIYIFTLPKGIIKKEATPITHEAVAEKKSDEGIDMKKMHQSEATDIQKNQIKDLTNRYLTATNSEKKINFADSLANLYRNLHNYDSALKYIDVVANAKNSPQAYTAAGDYNFEAYSFTNGNNKATYNEDARKYYNKALAITPKDYNIKTKLAMTYIGGENPMEGIGILKGILKEDPKNETAMYQLGILALQSGQNDKAVVRFEELIKLYPGNANAHYYLGVGYANIGKKEKAIASLEKAKELETDKGFKAAVDDFLADLKK
jgi:tetratricopeptide (TPR) repeat protein